MAEGAPRKEKAHQITEYSPKTKTRRFFNYHQKEYILNTYRHDAGEGRRGERQRSVRRLSLFERISFLGGHFVFFGCSFYAEGICKRKKKVTTNVQLFFGSFLIDIFHFFRDLVLHTLRAWF